MMGSMRFFAPRPERAPADIADCAYIAGMESVPWQRVADWKVIDETRGELTVNRDVDDSGNLYVPWNVPEYGELMLTTASLMVREEPYNLPLELARGTLNSLRNQAAFWELNGILLSEELGDAINAASRAFVKAITSLPDQQLAADEAETAIQSAIAASAQLCAEYTSQCLATRKKDSKKLTTLFSMTLESDTIDRPVTEQLLEGFNTAVVPFAWRQVEETAGKYNWDAFDEQIEWCQSNKLRVISGPLLSLDEAHLPDWIYLWEDDFAQLQSYFAHYISAAVEKYKGKVQVWNCAARMNRPGAVKLNEEQKLRLIVSAIEEVRRNDAQTPMIVCFDQPWAEYLASKESDLSPLHVADSLIRADFGVAGIGLELNVGYHPRGTLPRTLLEYCRQLDAWSELGLPLIVYLTMPSQVGEDPLSTQAARPFDAGDPTERQVTVVEQLVPLLLAKSYVHGIVWGQTSDSTQHDYAHGGLFDAEDATKPVCEALRAIRQAHLI